MSSRIIGGIVLAASLALPASGFAQQSVELLSVVPPDDATDGYHKADAWLLEYLNRSLATANTGIALEGKTFESYGQEIEDVVTRSRSYLARMTPYALVAAEMLGANLEVLATYESRATNSTTYHSYLVVNKASFGAYRQSLDGVYDYLKESNTRPRFIFHDQFSTSSYFLPALWLRSKQIFNMPRSTQQLTAIDIKAPHSDTPASSTDSVKAVAAGEADLAAVWDGTKAKFQNDPTLHELFSKVWFIELPEELPNDLLVASRLDSTAKKVLAAAIERIKTEKPDIGGDFQSWTTYAEAPAARRALATLRQLAATPPAPVVVRVDAETEPMREALRKAVRLSKPEFVLYDRDYHARWDVQWSMQSTHDSAVEMSVLMNGSETPQRYPLSYLSAQGDLTERIVALVRSRLPRVRYLWPYQEIPTILGDTDFNVGKGTALRVERIIWADLQSNDFRNDAVLPATIDAVDFYKLRLKWDAGSRDTSRFDLHNPLSNVAYRVVLTKPSYESRGTQLATVSLIGLLGLAAIGAGYDYRRRARPASTAPSAESLDDICAEMSRAVHEPWRTRTVTDAHVVWCGRSLVEETVQELKAKNLVSPQVGGVVRRVRQLGIATRIPLLKGLITVDAGQTHSTTIEADPARVGDAARLSMLLQLLVEQRQLSLFAGAPVEWSAMNRLTAGALGLATTGQDPMVLLRPDAESVLAVVSERVTRLLEHATQHLCLFRTTWTVGPRDGRDAATAVWPLAAEVRVGHGKPVGALAPWFELPDRFDRSELGPDGTMEVWLLGKIKSAMVTVDGGGRSLGVHFVPIAILRDTLD